MEKDLLVFTTSGSVDDGKSTLIGRLLYETKSIPEDQYNSIKTSSEKRGKSEVDLSFLLDGLDSEREQGITIDVSYRYFETSKRKFIVADTPGHEQYTRNMVTGASNAELAIILIDARNGVVTQSKRHGFINSLLGISHLIVAINKMDLVDYSEEVYNQIVNQYNQFSEKLEITDITYIPISSLCGDNITRLSHNMPWYNGSTILDKLENVHILSSNNNIDFRFSVQTVIRPNLNFRGFAGRVSSGSIRVGDEITIFPSCMESRATGLFRGYDEVSQATVGDSVTITIEDEIDISRGDMIVKSGNLPIISDRFETMLCWMDDSPLESKSYILKHTTNTTNCFINEVKYTIDVNTLHKCNKTCVSKNDICKVIIETTSNIYFDSYKINKETGSFILIDPLSNNTVACGMIRKKSDLDIEERHLSGESENQFTGDLGRVFWMTGLSGSGKSSIATELYRRFDEHGERVIILDGDSIRKGLNSDLGFTIQERKENLRRVAEVAKLFSSIGINVITSFISPTIEDRVTARKIIGDSFIEIYVKCPLEVCEKRDTKGLYSKARYGEIKNFTGISSIYEEPESPDILIDSSSSTIEKSVDLILNYFEFS